MINKTEGILHDFSDIRITLVFENNLYPKFIVGEIQKTVFFLGGFDRFISSVTMTTV
jgi:hypothetical protein